MTFGCTNGKWGWYGSGKPVETAPVQINEHGNKVIPMPVAEEAYLEYEAQGHGAQSLARLNERGGFGWSELAILLWERCARLSARLVLIKRNSPAPDAVVWIVGKALDVKASAWQFQGVFLSEEVAASKCVDASYFIGPATLGHCLPHSTVEWIGARYPKA